MKEQIDKHWLKQEELKVIRQIPGPSYAFICSSSERDYIVDEKEMTPPILATIVWTILVEFVENRSITKHDKDTPVK